jgi:hypothetical protein
MATKFEQGPIDPKKRHSPFSVAIICCKEFKLNRQLADSRLVRK